jgi:hypothetical protein
MFYDDLQDEPIDIVEWLAAIVISFIPVVGQGMLLFWAFNKDVDKNKSNYAKACLIFQVFLVLAWFLFIKALFIAK